MNKEVYEKQLDRAIEYAAAHRSYNLLNVIEQAEPVCVFGLGTYFREAFRVKKVKERFHVTLLCDNDSDKWGKQYEGIPCISPEELKTYDNVFVIVMMGNPIPVLKQMRDAGINAAAYLDISLDYIMDIPRDSEWFQNETEAVRHALKLFEDEESWKVYVNALCNRMAMPVSEALWDELYHEEIEYFNQNYYSLDDKESYVDCGAYTGDSIQQFCSVVKQWDKIHAFELDRTNYEQMSANLSGYDNIQLYNYGVWNENKQIPYGEGNSDKDPRDGISIYKAEKSTKEKQHVAEVRRLDDVLSGERVTLLKMDIEGAEYQALLGASQIIKTQKPKLAICVYHKNSDFWQIPLLLKELNPDYRFVLRHETAYSRWGTVLYGV